MVQLCKVVPPKCGEVFVKLEWENPTGSVKDRMAQAVISRAEDDGENRGQAATGQEYPICPAGEDCFGSSAVGF